MNRYRVSYVNVAFAPRASRVVIEAESVDAVPDAFREKVNQGFVIRTVGNDGIVGIEPIDEGGCDDAE